MSNVNPSKTNVSLVAFYGDKPPQLTNLIKELQTCLLSCESIEDKFIPYQLEQVHGTIIGCEGRKAKSGIISQWFEKHRQKTRYIDLEGLVAHLQYQIHLPLTIRFGGYDRDREYNFHSRDRHLYFRSFQLQPAGNTIIPVLMGWSWNNNEVSLAIDELRRKFQDFSLLHKYHATPDATDNDFYLRLGTIDTQLPAVETEEIATKVRNILAERSPLYVPINRENIAFARYQDLFLTPAKTEIVPITEITVERLQQMYFRS